MVKWGKHILSIPNYCYLKNLIDELQQLFKTPHKKESWRRLIKHLLNIKAYTTMQH